VRDPVSLRDLAATVVDLLDAEKDSPFPGQSLVRFWNPRGSGSNPRSGPVLSEVSIRQKESKSLVVPPAWRGRMASLVAEGRTYIRNPDDSEELFEVYNDPAQVRNLAGSPEALPILGWLRARLTTLCAGLTGG
jgi:hypothetical protein